MKNLTRIISLMMALCALGPSVSPAATLPRLDLGATLWRADNGQNQATLWGPTLHWPTHSGLALDAHWLQGIYNQGGDIEHFRETQITFTKPYHGIDLLLGYRHLDYRNRLQRGFIWSYPTEADERNADIHGPVVGLRGQTSPLFWGIRMTAGALWLPVDFGEFDDLGFDGSHWDIDLGLAATYRTIDFTLGYRYRKFRDLPDRIVNDRAYDRSVMDGMYTTFRFMF